MILPIDDIVYFPYSSNVIYRCREDKNRIEIGNIVGKSLVVLLRGTWFHMSKKINIVILLICLLVFTGCNKEVTSAIEDKSQNNGNYTVADNKKETPSVEENGKDRTVPSKGDIQPKEYSHVEEIESQCDYGISSDLEKISEASDEVVEGTIESVAFVSIEGDAWTKVGLKIKKALYGTLKANDKITVYQSGGYVPLKDHIAYYDDAFRYKDWSKERIASTVFYEKVEGEEAPVVGTTAIYYLNKAKQPALPKGVYNRVCGKYAELEKMDGNTYRHYDMKASAKKEYEEVSISLIQDTIKQSK